MGVMRLRVPYIRQSTDVFCGPACAKMVLTYFGINTPSQDTLARIMKTDRVGENGTQHRKLADYLREKGLVVRVSRRATLKDIENALTAGTPPIVHHLEAKENDDHYSVVVELTTSHIVLNDPWNG
jgi:predicted double-glycine peptidase